VHEIVCNIASYFGQSVILSIAVGREIVDTMVQAYSQKIFNGQLPVFDGRRNLYSREPLPIGREKVGHLFYFS